MNDASDHLAYEVIAVAASGRRGRQCRQVGRYPDLASALRGRVEDVLVQLVANRGGRVLAAHVIMGPSPNGPAPISCCATEIGVDTLSSAGLDQVDLERSREWLCVAHGLAVPPGRQG